MSCPANNEDDVSLRASSSPFEAPSFCSSLPSPPRSFYSGRAPGRRRRREKKQARPAAPHGHPSSSSSNAGRLRGAWCGACGVCVAWPSLFCCTRGSAASPLSLSLSLSSPPCFSLSLVWGLSSLSLWCGASPLSTSDKKMRISIGEIRTVCEPAPLGHGGVRLLSHTASSPSSFFLGLLGGGVPPCFSLFPPLFLLPGW